MKSTGKSKVMKLGFKEKAMPRYAEINYKSLLEHLPDIVYKIDPGGSFLYVNNAVQSLGYSTTELIGKHFSYIVHPDDIAKISREKVLIDLKNNCSKTKDHPKLFDERRTGQRMTKDLEIRMVKKGNKEGVNVSVYAFGDIRYINHFEISSGAKSVKYVGTIGVIRDITERKKMEQEIQRLSRQLMTAKKDEREMIVSKLLHAINSMQLTTSPNQSFALFNSSFAQDPLTGREKEILVLIAKGYTNRKIADSLSISIKTVETHRARIMRKLSIHKAVDLLRYAIKTNLLEG